MPYDEGFKLPEDFYYPEATGEEILTSTPTGRPHLEKLIQGEPEWWVTTGGSRLLPKKIILSPDEILKKAIEYYNGYEFLQALLDKNFELFTIDTDNPAKLIPIKHNNLYILLEIIEHSMDKQESLKDIDVEKIAMNEGFSKDSILFLNEILDKNKNILTKGPYTIVMLELPGEIIDPRSDYNRDGFKTVLATLVGDERVEQTRMMDKIPDSVKLQLESVIRGTSEVISKAITRDLAILKMMDMYGDVDFPELPHLQYLSVYNCPIELTAYVLKRASNIREVAFENKVNWPFDESIIPELNNLEAVRFSLPADRDFILAFLKKSKNIQKISFDGDMICLNEILQDDRFAYYLPLIDKAAIKKYETKKKEDEEFFSKLFQKLEAGSRSGGASIPEKFRSVESGDFDTVKGDVTFNVDRLFFARPGFPDPPINKYRLKIYPELIIEKDMYFRSEGDFQLSRLSNVPKFQKSKEALLIQRNQEENCYYGQYTLSPKATWQALPSLSSQEELTGIYYEGKADDIEIKYVEEFNLFYVKNKTGKEVNFHFNVKVPTINEKLPDEILAVLDSFKFSQPKEKGAGGIKKIPGKDYSAEEFIQEIIKQRVGACRHRSIACKYLMEKQFPDFPVRLVHNDVHEYVEVFYNGKWFPYDLGGYSAELNINDNNRPIESTESFQSSEEQIEQATSSLEDNRFARWEPSKREYQSIKDFNHHVISQSENRNILVELSKSQTADYQYHLKKYCKSVGKPVYYIHSPKDLVCGADWIERQKDGTGLIRKGPGGELYQFLQENKYNSPVIIVNWNNFTAEEIAKFNSLIDKERLADGEPLPDNTHVVGLYDTNAPRAYQGNDFYSRFQTQEQYPPAVPLERSVREQHEVADGAIPVDLYESSNWKSMLLGRWAIEGKQLRFIEGPLLEAFRTGKPIRVSNPPDSETFRLFWENIEQQKPLYIGGQMISIPENFSYAFGKGYEWDKKNAQLVWESFPPQEEKIFVLNASNVQKFITNCALVKDELFEKPGWLQENAGQSISVEITGDLSEAQWCQLLDAAAHWKVKLHINPKENLSLPKEMKAPSQEALSQSRKLGYSDIIYTTDLDYSIRNIQTQHKKMQVIDISECNGTDIFTRLDHEKKEQEGKIYFEFSESHSDIFSRLKDGEDFILKGAISSELIDAVANYMLTKTNKMGNIILVTNAREPIKHLPFQAHMVTANDKKSMLEQNFSQDLISKLDQNTIENYSYIKLETMLRMGDAWLGLHHLPRERQTSSAGFSFDLSKEASEAFEKERLDQIRNVLSHQPYVFISGPTGAGKSTFIHNILTKQGYNIYNEEAEIEKWAMDESEGDKILFIDEANIGRSHYSRFEGMFDDPPQILINQKLHTLKPSHKIIFAGNPASYGGRHLPSLFDRHGNSVIFKTMPPAYLYHSVLSPIFDASNVDQKQKEEILSLFLQINNKLEEMSPDKVLMSPRELQMMSLLTLSMNDPDLYLAKAYEAAYDLAVLVLPEEKRNEFETWFNQMFLNVPVLPNPKLENKLEDFILTPSRYKAYHQMEDFLRVREYQRNSDDPGIQFAGLGGIVLEAEPGVGKSDFVAKMLRKHNFREAHLTGKPVGENENVFYRIAPSLSKDEKEQILLKAFHEGAIVVIDELNSNGMMEKTMNTLLMGRDLNGKRANKPGFKIIGTENPITFEGRKARSIALQRRFMKSYFPEYPAHELLDILMGKGLAKDHSEKLLKQYLDARHYAKQHHKKPIPSPRMLFDVADYMLKSQNRKGKERISDVVEKKPEPQKRKAPLVYSESRPSENSTASLLFTNEQMEEVRSKFSAGKYFDILKVVDPTGRGNPPYTFTKAQREELHEIFSSVVQNGDDIIRTVYQLYLDKFQVSAEHKPGV